MPVFISILSLLALQVAPFHTTVNNNFVEGTYSDRPILTVTYKHRISLMSMQYRNIQRIILDNNDEMHHYSNGNLYIHYWCICVHINSMVKSSYVILKVLDSKNIATVINFCNNIFAKNIATFVSDINKTSDI